MRGFVLGVAAMAMLAAVASGLGPAALWSMKVPAAGDPGGYKPMTMERFDAHPVNPVKQNAWNGEKARSVTPFAQ